MKTLRTAGMAGLFLAIGAAGAQAQVTMLRPAIDGIGNAEAPVVEGVAAPPDGVDFAPAESAAASRGRVTVDSGTPIPTTSRLGRRKMWVIPR